MTDGSNEGMDSHISSILGLPLTPKCNINLKSHTTLSVPIVKILKWGVPLGIKDVLELRPGSDCVQTEWGGIVKGECRQPGWEPEVIAKAKKKKAMESIVFLCGYQTQ